jgi:serine protease AprX
MLKRSNPRAKPSAAGADPKAGFHPRSLDGSVIAMPMLQRLQAAKPGKAGRLGGFEPVIIDVNLDFPGGRAAAREAVKSLLAQVVKELKADPVRNVFNKHTSEQYLFGDLQAGVIRELVKRDRFARGPRGQLKPATEAEGRLRGVKGKLAHAIHKVWPDFPVRALIDASVRTVKADAARFSFSAEGKGVVWGVMDSGIDKEHVHFRKHGNLESDADTCLHKDFTQENDPFKDGLGHGTHVAGIIGGEVKDGEAAAYVRQRDEHGEIGYVKVEYKSIAGMAPQCKLVSLKVLDSEGQGAVSNLIAALDYVQEANAFGRRLRIHGINMSLGYDFDPEWFACGQSPLCVEVNRMVRSGVAVVVAAGNTGYAYVNDFYKGQVASEVDLSINDPGNADLAVTVGSTHRDSPHIYGVSYFSSKGPTGDGRLKPDLVAPGEKIVSCAAGSPRAEIEAEIPGAKCEYREHSGTSMAAPHVSGVIAAFLSVRREFIGQPLKVKEVFLSTATDLKRDRYFQGNGLVDLMRAIQSI